MTDALVSKWSIDVFSPRDDKWSVRAHLYWSDLDDVEVYASTEPLARAACVLLAADAIPLDTPLGNGEN